MSTKKSFFITMAGSWVKVFLSAVLLQLLNAMMEGHDLFTMDWSMVKKFIAAGVVALLPMVINFLNPNYPLYGSSKDSKVVDKKTGKKIAP